MTRQRMFGSDVPFCDWLRRQASLPSYSSEIGFVATDVDLCIHRYIETVDSMGTREIQSLMHVETKTRGGFPPDSQLDTLYKLDKIYRKKPSKDERTWPFTLRHLGVSILIMSGVDPDSSDWMQWVRFKKTKSGISRATIGAMEYLGTCRYISKDELLSLLRFDIDPDTFSEKLFRRHHKTRTITETILTPLGFSEEKRITMRS